MFTKSKKSIEIRPASQKPEDKSGVVVNKDAATSPRYNKENTQDKSAMRSESAKN